MPNKTIYVSDDDLPLFDRAQALAGGNLSAAVAQALRRFVATGAAAEEGYEEVTVRVGPPGSPRVQRFHGYRVAEWRHPHGEDGRLDVFVVYRTKGGRFAVHRMDRPNWEAWTDPDWWRDRTEGMGRSGRHGPPRHRMPGALGGWWRGGASSLAVYDTQEALESAELPPELVEMVRQSADAPRVEYLDI
jgi:EXLDI family protein